MRSHPNETSTALHECMPEAAPAPSRGLVEALRCRLLRLGADMRRREFLGGLGRGRGGVAARSACADFARHRILERSGAPARLLARADEVIE